jgi:glutamine amidotransferase
MTTIVDYGLGNIAAIENIYRCANISVRVAKCSAELVGSERLILPGVGSFDWAMKRLQESGMRETLDQLALQECVPVLGICVGMQMMADSSEEGKLPGLGWIPGKVKRFAALGKGETVWLPQMGWNEVSPLRTDTVFRGLDDQSRFYFLHSYYFSPLSENSVLARTDYFGSYASSVCVGKLIGVQFHPEKSHHCGVQLLKNFSELR